MTRLERHRQKLSELEARRGLLLRSGRYIQANNLNDDIVKARQLIKEAEEYLEATKPRPVVDMVSGEELDRMNIIPMMIECHLVADFLVDICYRIEDVCKEHGFTDVQFMPELKEILSKADTFAAVLAGMAPRYSDLLARNETFNASLHKKYMKYIEQRLAPRKS